MLRSLLKYLPFVVLLAACSADDKSSAMKEAPGSVNDKNPSRLNITLDSPQSIEGSSFVMYSLPLNEALRESETEYSGSSSVGRSPTYWDILFYDAKSGNSHFLGGGKRMVIRSFESASSKMESDNSAKSGVEYPPTATGKLLFYLVGNHDFNRDGKLDGDDPSYLFSSDKSGLNFRQISPDYLHVTDWKIEKITGKILISTLNDSNQDKLFDDQDESVPYVYDPDSQKPPVRVFDAAAILKLQQRFQRMWLSNK